MDSDRDGTAALYAEVDDEEIIDLEDDDEASDEDAQDQDDQDDEDDLESDEDEGQDDGDEEIDADLNRNEARNVKGDVIENPSSGGAQFTDMEVTGPRSAPPTGPAPLPTFESEAKGEGEV